MCDKVRNETSAENYVELQLIVCFTIVLLINMWAYLIDEFVFWVWQEQRIETVLLIY